MHTRTMNRLGVVAAVAAAMLLAGCTGTAPESTEDADGSAARFLACLTAAGVEAKISEKSGQVLVKEVVEPDEDGVTTFGSGAGFGDSLSSEGDDAGNFWTAARSSAYFADDPDTQDAYAACESEHPDFAQPESPPPTSAEQEEYLEQQAADGLTFARCARDAGFAWVADPIGGGGTSPAIALTDDVTEEEFRALLDACWSPELNLAWSTPADLSWDWLAVLDELSGGAGNSITSVTEGEE